MADHQDAVESRWGNVDPESLYHLSIREPATRAAIREFSTLESAAIHRFQASLQCLRAFQKGA